MATFNIPCSFPTDPVHIFVFAEVLNAIELKSRLSSGDTDYLYAFVDAELVVSELQVLAAVNRALHDDHYGTMRTKHLHAEIVYAIGAVQNIGEAFKLFGLAESTKHIVVVKVSSLPREEVHNQLRKIVDGRELPFTTENLRPLASMAKVAKYYKLGSSSTNKRKGQEVDIEERWKNPDECTKLILGNIALRGST